MMTMDKAKLPYAATEYIAKRFREEFLFELKEHKQVKGQWIYVVEVSQDDFIHTLQFDEKGALVREEADPAFPADAHDGPAPEEVPE
jgi:hypothetical protein